MQDLRLIGVHEDGHAPAARGRRGQPLPVRAGRAASGRRATGPSPAGAAADRDRRRSASRGVQSMIRAGPDGRGGGRAGRVDGREGAPLRGTDPRRARVHVAGPGPAGPGPVAGCAPRGRPCRPSQGRVAQRMRERASTPSQRVGRWRGVDKARGPSSLTFAAGGRQRQAAWTLRPAAAHGRGGSTTRPAGSATTSPRRWVRCRSSYAAGRRTCTTSRPRAAWPRPRGAPPRPRGPARRRSRSTS